MFKRNSIYTVIFACSLLSVMLLNGVPSIANQENQHSFDCTTVTDVPQAECEALVALYNSTDGTNWSNNSGWLESSTVCDWYRVTCSDNAVTRLSLTDNQLTGSIPPELGNLGNLERLWLDNNHLTGNIPPGLGSLSKLEKLALHYNQLTGNIPSELGNLSNLGLLYLQDNQLTGNIPSELGSLSNSWDLRLNNNQLTGSIPSELGNLSNLWTLDLEHNQLTGNIPSELGNLDDLEWLQLYDNQLTGSIPPELGNLSSLWRLDLAANQLTGSIPPQLGNLNNLGSLWLFSNQLTGSIPSELGNLSNLSGLYLSSNQLTESIPPELGDLSNLGWLYLSHNNLSGNVPAELSNLSNLDSLLLDDNQLNGSLPQSLVNLNLTRFYFNDTALCEPANATFQAWLASIPNLQSTNISCLSLEINFTSGAPSSFFTVTGTDFPADSTATITVNGQVLGTVTADSDGNLTFLLSTTNADEGSYFVTVTVNPGATVHFVLDSNEPVRPQGGSGPILDVPAGIAFTEFIYLPTVLR